MDNLIHKALVLKLMKETGMNTNSLPILVRAFSHKFPYKKAIIALLQKYAYEEGKYDEKIANEILQLLNNG